MQGEGVGYVADGAIAVIGSSIVAVAPSAELAAHFQAGGVVLTADEEAVRAEAQIQAEALARRVAVDPMHERMALLKAMETGWL
jgi:hypothetical protein